MEHKNKYYNQSVCSRFIKDIGNKVHRILLDASKDLPILLALSFI